MLGIRAYDREYIEAIQARVEADVAAFDRIAANVKDAAAREAFEASFFNNQVILLDAYFVHRLRTVEGKDGNPLNEVRVIANSLMLNDGVMTVDRSINLLPAKSVLGYEYGAPVRVTEADFRRLAEAYFAAIERKFAEAPRGVAV